MGTVIGFVAGEIVDGPDGGVAGVLVVVAEPVGGFDRFVGLGCGWLGEWGPL